MAISSSGSIGLNTLQSEFGGSNPIGISEYYNADPHKPTPSSGTIDLNSFRGSSGRTAKIVTGQTSEPVPLKGYTSTNGGYYEAQYGGKSGAAIGSITRTSGLTGSGRTLAGFVVFRDADVINSWTSTTRRLYILQRGTGSTGWSSVNIKIGVSSWTLNRSSFGYDSSGSGMSPSGSFWGIGDSFSGSAVYQIHASMQSSGTTVLIRFD